MRSQMINVLGEDYITFAEAKGLHPRRIFVWYGMRNALLAQVTALALSLGSVVSGAVLVEVIFNYPGLGSLLYVAIRGQDYFVIQGVGSGSEIDIQGNNQPIADGNATPSPITGTDFGSANTGGGVVVRTFTIFNTGSQPLDLTGTPLVQLSDPTNFSVIELPPIRLAVVEVTMTWSPACSSSR